MDRCQVVTWILVIMGWFFVDERNNKRELRKEKRSLIDRINIDLNSIEKMAIEYHQHNHSDIKLSQEIKVSLDRVIKILNREQLIHKKDRTVFISFKRSITLKNFDSSEFVPQLDNSELLKNIYLAKDSLLHSIETKFNDDFRRSFSKYFMSFNKNTV